MENLMFEGIFTIVFIILGFIALYYLSKHEKI